MRRVGHLLNPVKWEIPRYGSRVPFMDADDFNGVSIARIPVVIGGIKPMDYYKGRSAVKYRWYTDGGGLIVETGVATTLDLLRGLFSGQYNIVDGWIDHTWTFTKQGDEIFIVPIGDREWVPE